ncbi:MAG: hypothetical protein ACO1RX_07810 [Candidatus Sericytochromatia bacterium]
MHTFSAVSLRLILLLTLTACRTQPETAPDTVVLIYHDADQRADFQNWFTSLGIEAEVRQNGTLQAEYVFSPSASTPADWQEQLQKTWGSRCQVERRPQRLYLLCGKSGT